MLIIAFTGISLVTMIYSRWFLEQVVVVADVGEDDEDDEDESQSSSVAQDDVDSSSTKHHFSGHHVTQQANQPSNPNLQATSVDLATNVKNPDSPSENEKSSDSSSSAVSGHQDDHETELANELSE